MRRTAAILTLVAVVSLLGTSDVRGGGGPGPDWADHGAHADRHDRDRRNQRPRESGQGADLYQSSEGEHKRGRNFQE